MSASTTSSLCKIVSCVIAVLGGLGTIIYAFVMAVELESFFLFLIVLLAGSLSVFLTALPLYALGEILERVCSVQYRVSGLNPEPARKSSLFARNTIEVSGKTPAQQGSGNAPVVRRTVGPWSCSCGQTNADTDQFCKNCGKYK